MNVGRLILATVIAGSSLGAINGIALASGGHNTATHAQHSSNGAHTAQRQGNRNKGLASGGPRKGGIWRGLGSACQAGVAGKVTGVSGNNITVTTRQGQTATVVVSSTTTYKEQGVSSPSLSNVQTGVMIATCGTRSGSTVQATTVAIILPRAAGVVTAVNGSALTLTTMDGVRQTVNVTSSTVFDRAGHSAALSDITTGTGIVAQGTGASDGSLMAVRVEIRVPRVAGRVTAVNGSTITLASGWGVTTTVQTTSDTIYAALKGTTASASSVAVGTYIVAEGTRSGADQPLNALRITVLPAGARGKHGGFGGSGFGRNRYGLGGELGAGGSSSTSASA